MNNLLQKLFYCLNERHFSAEMYVINPDALFNTTGKQRQFILSYVALLSVYLTFSTKLNKMIMVVILFVKL